VGDMKRKKIVAIFLIFIFLLNTHFEISALVGEIVNIAPRANLSVYPIRNITLNVSVGAGYTKEQVQGYFNQYVQPKLYASGVNAKITLTETFNERINSSNNFYILTGRQNGDAHQTRDLRIYKADSKGNPKQIWSFDNDFTYYSELFITPSGRAFLIYSPGCRYWDSDGNGIFDDIIETTKILHINGETVKEIFSTYKSGFDMEHLYTNQITNVRMDEQENIYFTETITGKMFKILMNTGTLVELTDPEQYIGESVYMGWKYDNQGGALYTDSLYAGEYYNTHENPVDGGVLTSRWNNRGDRLRIEYTDKSGLNTYELASLSYTHAVLKRPHFIVPRKGTYLSTWANSAKWSTNSEDKNFAVIMDNNYFDRLETESALVSEKINNGNAFLIALGNNKNSTQLQNLVNKNKLGGKYIDNSNISKAFDELVDYILEKSGLPNGANIVVAIGNTNYSESQIKTKINSLLITRLRERAIYPTVAFLTYNTYDNPNEDINYLFRNGEIVQYNEKTDQSKVFNLISLYEQGGNLGRSQTYAIKSPTGICYFHIHFERSNSNLAQSVTGYITPSGIMQILNNTKASSVNNTYNYPKLNEDEGYLKILRNYDFPDTTKYVNLIIPKESYKGFTVETYLDSIYNYTTIPQPSTFYTDKGKAYLVQSDKVYFNNKVILNGAYKLVPSNYDKNKNLLNVIRSANWNYMNNFLVTIDNGIIDEFQPYYAASDKNELVLELKKNSTDYAAIGNNSLRSTYDYILNGTKNTFIDDSNIDDFLEELADYIVDRIEEKKESTYVVLGEKGTISAMYSDYESDPKNADFFRSVLKDPYYFKNPTYKGEPRIIEGSSLDNVFTNVGKYELYYRAQDNPKNDSRFDNYKKWSDTDRKFVYVHRRPIADFRIKFTQNSSYYNVSLEDLSYDLDHLGEPNNGIVGWEWQYSTNGNTWTPGQPSQSINYSSYQKIYVKLRVKDLEGEWSEWVTKSLSPSEVINNAPVARFIAPSTVDLNDSTLTIEDYSYDPDNDPIAQWEWAILNSQTGNVIKNCGSSKPTMNDLRVTNLESFTIRLRVRDNPTGRGSNLTPLWSNYFYQTINVAKNTKPVADFDFTENPMYQYADNEILDFSFDPDDDELIYHWQLLTKNGTLIKDYGSTTPDLSLLDAGDYKVKLEVTDIPKVGSPLTSDPCIKDLKVVLGQSFMEVVIDPPQVDWTNQKINVTVHVIEPYNYRRTYYMFSPSPIQPTYIQFIENGQYSTLTDFTVTLNNIKANEGRMYLHVLAMDAAAQVYARGGQYRLDVTPPTIDYDHERSLLTIVDELSGPTEVYFLWNLSSTPVDAEYSGGTLWDGGDMEKPEGPPMYLHVKAYDRAGNSSTRTMGPFEDLLKLTNFRIVEMVNPPYNYSLPIGINFMPVDVKSGYRNSFQIDVKGKPDEVTVHITDNTGKDHGTVNIKKIADIDHINSVWGFDYATDLFTPKDTIFIFEIQARKNSFVYDFNAKESWNGRTLRIVGSALEDTWIRRKY